MLRKLLSLERLLALVLVITLTVTSLPLIVLAEKISQGDDYVVYKAPEIKEEIEETEEEILEELESNLEFVPDVEGYDAMSVM